MILSLRSSSHHLAFFRLRCISSAPDMARRREAFARRMAMAGVKPHHRIALGVSGGPDSMALCVLTARWKSDGLTGRNETSGCIEGLLGIVVDHKLRPGSLEEASQVHDWVSMMGIKCVIECCDWSDGRPKQGHLQEAAREKRYQIFQGVCIKQQIGVLLIAHHADDQAELFILRLSRNSGVLGLAGMAFVSQLFPKHLNYCGENSDNQGIILVRPMLEFSKDDMYKICQEGHQEWVEDPTNRSQLFARNRIRNSLQKLSSSKSRCPKFVITQVYTPHASPDVGGIVEGIFKSEIQNLISACRFTRSYIDNICHKIIKHSVTIMDHGYAIVNLERLEPSNVDDICLSKFLALILQFISQRHRPIRGGVSQLLLDYIRNSPCKTSLTAAGCYLCAAPRSEGTKILVCYSVGSPQSSRICSSYKFFCEEEQPSLCEEIDQVIMDSKSFSDQSIPKASSVPFLYVKSSETILYEAEKLNLISESTFATILLLKQEESKNFSTKLEVDSDQELRNKMKPTSVSSIPLHPGESCHFMSRFMVTWKLCKGVTVDGFSSGIDDFNKKPEENQDHLCQSCIIDQETTITVRHMVDADWLFLSKLSEFQTDEYFKDRADGLIKFEQDAIRKVQGHSYMQLSAWKALQALKSIPVHARRGLPVLVNSHGLLLSIPSICFRCCPCLSVVAVFKPRVPLGGGYSSYM